MRIRKKRAKHSCNICIPLPLWEAQRETQGFTSSLPIFSKGFWQFPAWGDLVGSWSAQRSRRGHRMDQNDSTGRYMSRALRHLIRRLTNQLLGDLALDISQFSLKTGPRSAPFSTLYIGPLIINSLLLLFIFFSCRLHRPPGQSFYTLCRSIALSHNTTYTTKSFFT